jgi:hypothetical protein
MRLVVTTPQPQSSGSDSLAHLVDLGIANVRNWLDALERGGDRLPEPSSTTMTLARMVDEIGQTRDRWKQIKGLVGVNGSLDLDRTILRAVNALRYPKEVFRQLAAMRALKYFEERVEQEERDAREREKYGILDDRVCAYCGSDEGPFEVDHIVPLAKGGTDDPRNLACACRTCNRSKKDRLIAEWLGEVA